MLEDLNLSKYNKNKLEKIGPFTFVSDKKNDPIKEIFGKNWWIHLQAEKLATILIGTQVYFKKHDEYGIIYQVWIFENSKPFPTLNVGYNINGGGEGSKIVELIDLSFGGKTLAKVLKAGYYNNKSIASPNNFLKRVSW